MIQNAGVNIQPTLNVYMSGMENVLFVISHQNLDYAAK